MYVNRGLVTMVETESELASVLAHEIAHINKRHVASIIEKSQKVGIANSGCGSCRCISWRRRRSHSRSRQLFFGNRHNPESEV